MGRSNGAPGTRRAPLLGSLHGQGTSRSAYVRQGGSGVCRTRSDTDEKRARAKRQAANPIQRHRFFEKAQFGGILCDIASHQADQFLYFTGSTKADVVSAQVGNVHFPQWPNFEDFGDIMLRGDKGTGYIRVDWFTPDGLPTWGDGRLTVLGTDGFIEVRKNLDVNGRPGGSYLLLSDQKETRYIDCSKVDLPYGEQLVNDVLNRTETAMPQAHCYLATELVLKAQQQAQKLMFKT